MSLRRSLLVAAFSLASAVLSTATAAPTPANTRNPLTPIPAISADDKSPDIKTEADTTPPAASATPAEHFANVHAGDFALYRGLDFDSGVAALKATVAGPNAGSLELHLDAPTGPLLVTCPFQPTGGWEKWQDITANVDHSQAGVRDVYVLFRAAPNAPASTRALVNLRGFVFLKSVVTPTSGVPDLAARLDSPDAHEPQGIHAWGIPENGFKEEFCDSFWRTRWQEPGDLQPQLRLRGSTGPDAVGAPSLLSRTSAASAMLRAPADAETSGEKPLFTWTRDAYLNPTDIGGDWRTLAEGSLRASLAAASPASRPGVGFASKDGHQAVYAVLNPADKAVEVWRKLADGTTTLVHREPGTAHGPFSADGPPDRRPDRSDGLYTLQLDWSPYSDALIVRLVDRENGQPILDFRTVIDLPAARYPLLVNSGGPATFADLHFDPTLDDWNYHWEWYKQPILGPDVCNPAVWRGPSGSMYMLWRKFGADTFHGIAKSDDGVHWIRVNDQAIKVTGDMTVLQDPFGDGKWYASPGSANQTWWSCDGTDDFKTWTQTDKKLGDIHGHNRIQEIIDTKRYPQLHPISYEGREYRFLAYCEDWVHAPQPHSVVLLSNTLTDWVEPTPDPVMSPANDFWGEKGNAIGSAYPLPDGNILIADCACTYAGYTGAPEPTNISAIASGTEPWKLIKKAVLPDAPVSRENVWYQGPNFATAFFYDDKNDTLFLYGGFHDYKIGVMRVRHFLHPAADKLAHAK